MDAQPLISVIVPVYNTVHYLDRSLGSLTKQTWRNLDIVVIDDGSTDGSAEALDSWADRDSRIRVVHQPNAGVAAARNRGLDEARGAIIAWLDSDDWIEPDYLRELAEAKARTGADMAENFRGSRRHPERMTVIEGDDIIRDFLLGRLSGALWSTLTDAGKYEGLRFFDSLSIGEDTYMLLQVRSRCRRETAYCNNGYHYNVRSDSAVHQIEPDRYYAWFRGLDLRKEFVAQHRPDALKFMSYRYVYEPMVMLRAIRGHEEIDGVEALERHIKSVISKNVLRIPYRHLNSMELKEIASAVKHVCFTV